MKDGRCKRITKCQNEPCTSKSPLNLGALIATITVTTCACCVAGDDDHRKMDGFLAEAAALLPVEAIAAQPPPTPSGDPTTRVRLGEWSPVMPWPHIPVSAANLPDGRIVTWASSQRNDFPGGDPEFTYAAVYDPATNRITEINHTEHDMFCGHPAMLASGFALVAGGRNTVRHTSYFDYRTDQWVRVEDMNDTRWYPTTTALPDGTAITASGSFGTGIDTVEHYVPGSGWKRLSSIDWEAIPNKALPHNFVAPDGRIISAGPEGNIFWLDPYAKGGTGELVETSAIFPGNRITQSGGVAMYNEGKIVFAGGTVADGATTAIAHSLDVNGSVPEVTAIASMHHKRNRHNTLMLPSGDLIVVGGNAVSALFSDVGTVYEPETWNPTTDTWTELAPAAVPRNYHSIALLLPDGRVFSGGGGLSGNAVTDHQDAQFFSPPYLFDDSGAPATRPAISSAPESTGAGQTIRVGASADAVRFTLVRMSAITHAFSSDVRFLEVPFTQASTGLYDLTLNPNPNVLIPGYWMLFALNGIGTPSVAHILKISIPTVPVLASPGNQQGLIGEAVALAIVANDGDGDRLSFAATGLPSGLTMNPTSGLITGTPRLAEVRTVILSVTDGTHTVSKSITWQTLPVQDTNFAPDLVNPGPQISAPNKPTELVITGFDRNGDSLLYSATNLPVGVSIDPASGVISGTPASPETRTVSLSLTDGVATATISFDWTTRPKLHAAPIAQGPLPAGASNQIKVSAEGHNLQYTWNFGDDSTPIITSIDTASHTFDQPGRYIITVDISDDSGQAIQTSYHQAIYSTPTENSPAISQSIAYEQRAASHDRVWNVNPDNDSTTVIDTVTRQLVATIAVGGAPRSLALSRSGEIWVTEKRSAGISVISSSTLAKIATIQLPDGSAPHGIVISPTQDFAFVALEGTGQVAKISTVTKSILAATNVGATPRHLSINAAGSKVYVSRYLAPPSNEESTLSPLPTTRDGGRIVVLNAIAMNVVSTINLGFSSESDTPTGSRGIPNYLGPAAISPDGATAWVASKQDNVERGVGRDGNPLNFEHTLRGISSRIDLQSDTASPDTRSRHDNAGIAVTSTFGRWGNFVLVALEGSRSVAVMDAFTGRQVTRFESGRAPQGLALSPDGRTLFVHNFTDRSVSAHDLSQLINGTGEMVSALATIKTVATDALPDEILQGKQLFYDSADRRIAQDYVSCASCHNEGGHDGRVWDFTGFGEGLRNTIDLRGRGGLNHGPVHWTGSFDEIQDFEHPIRAMAGGTGLISSGPHPALGAPNNGRSADLDALAAYVASLDRFTRSPYRNQDGTLTPDAVAGREIFRAKNCADCHTGDRFTDSALNVLHDIGTIKLSSGSRLAGTLVGIDTPTLRGVWDGAPYLHDGSAATLEDAVAAHSGVTLTSSKMQQLTAYLQQIDDLEGPAPTSETSPFTWIEWTTRHRSGSDAALTPYTNSDGDYFVDLIEYALGNSPSTGVSHSSFTIEKEGPDERIAATYRRPSAIRDIVYSIEVSDDRTDWQPIQPNANWTITTHADGTETVRVRNLDSLPNLSERGYARLSVQLVGSDHRAASPDFAWLRVPLHSGYQTIGVSTLQPPSFAGLIANTDGNTVTCDGCDLTGFAENGTSYFLEIRTGPLEGHRVDIDSTATTGSTITLDATSPHNTLNHLPASAIGHLFAVHEHCTVNDIFPRTRFTGSTNPNTSDRIHFFHAHDQGFESLFLLHAGANSSVHQWVTLANADLEDFGKRVIAPGAGLFLQRPPQSTPLTLTQIGMVRANKFRQILSTGYNLVASGYPVELTPAQRRTGLNGGFRGSVNPSSSDQIQFWRGDIEQDASEYESYFLLDAGPSSHYQYWTSLRGTELINYDNRPLFHPGRAAFILLRNAAPDVYEYDAPQ